MKPKSLCESRKRRFPQTDYFFRSDMGEWRGYWSAPDDGGESAQRRFYDFTREFLLESERARLTAIIALSGITARHFVGDGASHRRGRNSVRYSGVASGAKPWRMMFSVTTRGTRKFSK